jgi:hypothetical protein
LGAIYEIVSFYESNKQNLSLELYHFAAVAETGSFTKAATSLRTETSDMTILCFALSNDRARTRDESRFFALIPTRMPVHVRVRDVV